MGGAGAVGSRRVRHAGDVQNTHAVQGTGGRMESSENGSAQGAPVATEPVATERVALTKEKIRNAPDRRKRVVHVAAWGGDVLVIGMGSNARDAYESSMVRQRGGVITQNWEMARVKMVIAVTHTLDGVKMFTDEDAGWLGEKSGEATDIIFTVGKELSGMTEKDMGELVGNFTGDRGAASS